MTHMHRSPSDALILLVLLAAAGLRLYVYGDPRLSVGYTDTSSYVRSAAAPLFSWEMFAGERPFTTNLVYKLAADPERCLLIAVSRPRSGVKFNRGIQPCFDRIALLQNALSVLAWSFLAWAVSRGLRHPALRVVGAALVVLFAFTPQIAEWDYLLSPESLTLSLFALVFALAWTLCTRAFRAPNLEGGSRYLWALTAAWLAAYFLWVFVRDVHLYTLVPTTLLVLFIPASKDFRRSRLALVLGALLGAIFLLGCRSARDSLRASIEPLRNAFETYIFPYPQRVAYMESLGMPVHGSAVFQDWFDANATGAYGLYLASHPGFVLATLGENAAYFKAGFEQPYFRTRDIRWRRILLELGRLLHPETLAVYVFDGLILLLLLLGAARLREPPLLAWTWLALWAFACAVVTLLPAFFGDTVGIGRHIFPSVEMFRLYLWVSLLVLIDRGVAGITLRDTVAISSRDGAARLHGDRVEG